MLDTLQATNRFIRFSYGCILVWGLSAGALRADDASCLTRLGALYAGAENAKVVLATLPPDVARKVAEHLEKSKGYTDDLLFLSSVFFDEFKRGLPEGQRESADFLKSNYEMTTAKAVGTAREQLDALVKDPVGELSEGFRVQEEIDRSLSTVTIPREIYSIKAAFDLMMLEEIRRIQSHQFGPAWHHIAFLNVSIPWPAESMRRYRSTAELADIQWQYLNLIPPKYHARLLEELVRERNFFINRATHDEVKTDLTKLFDAMEITMRDAFRLPRKDFVAAQKSRFDWRGQLTTEYVLKLAWAGIVGGMIYASLQPQ